MPSRGWNVIAANSVCRDLRSDKAEHRKNQ